MARINRAVELLADGQPIYYAGCAERGYEAGREAARTWADYLCYDMEHNPYDISTLRAFMRGLIDGGPTPSGHRAPAVIVTLPIDGESEAVVRANSWVIKQVLACGVHGLLLCHAETPEAVRAFVECARYPFNTRGVGQGLGEGRRGSGGQAHAAEVWGLPVPEYLQRADVWPLNPEGELLLGLKIENKRALARVEETLRVPGIAFAEWGPGDMGMSLGYPDNHDAPYPEPMQAARARVLAACKANGIAFLNTVTPEDIHERIAEGVLVGAGPHGREAAEVGRRHTGRTMPW
ncbi:MAG TPA: aldolase/citrate lyase family protein [Thermomicrobiales bacterium]|nr:aldolase/citrate lyase family protein [Thermomicrobiales bacterium]